MERREEKARSHGQGRHSAEEREARVTGDMLWVVGREEKREVRSVVGLVVCRGMQNPPIEEPKR